MTGREPAAPDYGASIARALAAARSRYGEPDPAQELRAKEAVKELLRLPPSARLERLRSDPRLLSLPAWRQLIDRAQALLPWQPSPAEALARGALTIACRLDPAVYGEGLPADCRVLSALTAARACLAAGRASAAKRALSAAEIFFDRASGDPYVRAEVDLARAAVAQAKGSLRVARTCLGRAAALFAVLGEPGREAAARAEEAEVAQAIQNRRQARTLHRPGSPRAARPLGAPTADRQGSKERG